MFKRNFVFIFIVVLLLALVFQFIRIDMIIDLLKNSSVEIEMDEAVVINKEKDENKRYLILYDKDDLNGVATKNQVVKTIDYIKETYDLKELKDEYDYNNYRGIIICFERMDFIKDIDKLFESVKEGASCFFALRPVLDQTFKTYYSEIGIDDYSDLVELKGFKFLSNVLLGGENFSYRGDVENSSIDLLVSKNAKIHMEAIDSSPLLFERDLGIGKIVVFNGTMTNEKLNRHVILSGIRLMFDALLQPVINQSLVYVDDFPAPIPNGKNKKIDLDYGLGIRKFYRHVWWPEMLTISKKYGVKYTGMIIETYNDRVSGDLKDTNSIPDKDFLYYGRELLRSGGELGLHGYNHQSLASEGYIKQDLGYNSWPSEDDMKNAIAELISFSGKIFPNYTFSSYVPPSNILGPKGRSALVSTMDDLKIIGSVYIDNIEKDIYDQEIEIAADGIIEYPRFTSGYDDSDESKWLLLSGINVHGVFSHFVHPDDVLDNERSGGKGWEAMRSEFENIIEFVDDNFSFLYEKTATESIPGVISYIESIPHIEYSDDSISVIVDNYRDGLCYYLYTDKIIKSINGGRYKKIDDKYYLIILEENKASILFKE